MDNATAKALLLSANEALHSDCVNVRRYGDGLLKQVMSYFKLAYDVDSHTYSIAGRKVR